MDSLQDKWIVAYLCLDHKGKPSRSASGGYFLAFLDYVSKAFPAGLFQHGRLHATMAEAQVQFQQTLAVGEGDTKRWSAEEVVVWRYGVYRVPAALVGLKKRRDSLLKELDRTGQLRSRGGEVSALDKQYDAALKEAVLVQMGLA